MTVKAPGPLLYYVTPLNYDIFFVLSRHEHVGENAEYAVLQASADCYGISLHISDYTNAKENLGPTTRSIGPQGHRSASTVDDLYLALNNSHFAIEEGMLEFAL